MKAIVVGGSVGGLMAALLLRKTGWDVMVYERAVTCGLDLNSSHNPAVLIRCPEL